MPIKVVGQYDRGAHFFSPKRRRNAEDYRNTHVWMLHEHSLDF